MADYRPHAGHVTTGTHAGRGLLECRLDSGCTTRCAGSSAHRGLGRERRAASDHTSCRHTCTHDGPSTKRATRTCGRSTTKNKARYDIRYTVYQDHKNKSHNKNNQQLIYWCTLRKISVITIDDRHGNTNKQCHGHQLEGNSGNASEIVDGNIRGPTSTTESQYKNSGISHHPSVYKRK